MPIKRSAQKALRQTKKRTVKNQAVKSGVKKAIKELGRKIAAAKDKKDATELMPKVTQALDKAAKVHVLNANAAARYKSRLQKAINKIL